MDIVIKPNFPNCCCYTEYAQFISTCETSLILFNTNVEMFCIFSRFFFDRIKTTKLYTLLS